MAVRAVLWVVVACLAVGGISASGWAADTTPDVLRIVFPEGWSARQMADRVAEVRRIAIERRGVTPRLTGADYTRAVRRARPPRGFRAEAGNNVEGFLFPALYQFEGHTTAETLVANQLAAFEQRWRTVDLRPARHRGRTAYEVLTIASMVERETVAPEERRLVAAVIYNRLDRNMPLGIDATLRYGLGIPGTKPLTKTHSREQLAVQHAPVPRSPADPDRQPRARVHPRRREPSSRRLSVLRPQAGQDPPLLHRGRRRVLPEGARVRLLLLIASIGGRGIAHGADKRRSLAARRGSARELILACPRAFTS